MVEYTPLNALQFSQAKEQGKADMEELLTKLQKVCPILSHCNRVCVSSLMFSCALKCVNQHLDVFFLFNQTNEEQQAKIEELQDKLDKVMPIIFQLLHCSLVCNLQDIDSV